MGLEPKERVTFESGQVTGAAILFGVGGLLAFLGPVIGDCTWSRRASVG